jgi:hypothetical protein
MTYPRILGPEALSEFYAIFDEVWKQLLDEGLVSGFDTEQVRTRLAKKVLAFAFRSRWSHVQITQLVIRAFRNEVARQHRPRRPQRVDVGAPTQESASLTAG